MSSTERQPVWDWTKGITYTALSRWLECPEQFALEYIEGWTPKQQNISITFGSMFHACHKEQQHGLDPEEVVAQVIHRFSQNNLRESQEFALACVCLEALWPSYVNHYWEHDQAIRWLYQEQVFEYDYEFQPGLKITLRGAWDGVYRFGKTDSLGLFETKTKSRIDDNLICASLRGDLQLFYYLFCLREISGETPREATYNVIRRPAQKLQRGDSWKSFRERVRKDVARRPPHYFRRWKLSLVERDLRNFEKQVLQPVLTSFHRWWEEISPHPFDRFRSRFHFVNLRQLSNPYGKSKLHDLLAWGHHHHKYYVRSSPFPELEERSSRDRAHHSAVPAH